MGLKFLRWFSKNSGLSTFFMNESFHIKISVFLFLFFCIGLSRKGTFHSHSALSSASNRLRVCVLACVYVCFVFLSAFFFALCTLQYGRVVVSVVSSIIYINSVIFVCFRFLCFCQLTACWTKYCICRSLAPSAHHVVYPPPPPHPPPGRARGEVHRGVFSKS